MTPSLSYILQQNDVVFQFAFFRMRYLPEASLLGLRPVLRSYEDHLKEARQDPPTEPYKSKYLAIADLGRLPVLYLRLFPHQLSLVILDAFISSFRRDPDAAFNEFVSITF